MPLEIEAKMKVDDFGPFRRQLAARGAVRVGSVLETNTFFDTADRQLVSQDKGLRLRRTRDDKTGQEEFIITFKGPLRHGELKTREEAEVQVDDAQRATALLHALGYEPTLSFEKRRESWQLDECKIELDELPILGRYVEIEGPGEEAVMQMRRKLNLDDQPLIQTGYITMLSRYLKEHGDTRRSISF